MNDITELINATHRILRASHRSEGRARTIVLQRTYDSPVEEVWDACTNPSRISRWFLPVSGDLHPGGLYQLEGNAGGQIVCCEPPRLLRLTWIFGDGPPAEVEVRLSSPGQDETVLELAHTSILDPEFWERFGPGAVGVGWDLALLALTKHLHGEDPGNHQDLSSTPETRELAAHSSSAWGDVSAACGVDPGEVAMAVARTTAFYGAAPASSA